MMVLSSLHITHFINYLLYIALVWVIRALLIKPPFIFWVLITVFCGLRTELRSTKLKGSPNLLPLREWEDGRESSQSRFDLISIVTQGLLGSL